VFFTGNRLRCAAAGRSVGNVVASFFFSYQWPDEEGLHQGLEKGRHAGEAELVLRLLARRLGALSVAQQKSIRKLPPSKIEELGEALLDFSSRDDLVRWLRANK